MNAGSGGAICLTMIGRLNHVAIVVPDLAAASKTYAGTLGAKVSKPVDLQPSMVRPTT